jgi:hypothetical protein
VAGDSPAGTTAEKEQPTEGSPAAIETETDPAENNPATLHGTDITESGPDPGNPDLAEAAATADQAHKKIGSPDLGTLPPV